MELQRIEVAAGLVFHEGRLLITQRPAGGHLAGLWEFPGGKREPGETFEECVRRELREELEIEVEPGVTLSEVDHRYPDKHVYLKFIRCRWLSGKPRAVGCQNFVWIAREQLGDFQFPAADAKVVQELSERTGWWTQAPG